jgi:hypothetical protein
MTNQEARIIYLLGKTKIALEFLIDYKMISEGSCKNLVCSLHDDIHTLEED